MPPNFSRKRSVSPSAVARRNKRLRVSGTSYSPNPSNIIPTNIPESLYTHNTFDTFNTSNTSNIFPPNIPESLNTFNTSTTSTTPTFYTTSGRTQSISSGTKINFKTQIQTNSEPLSKQFVAKSSPLQDFVVRGPLEKIDRAESKVIGIPIRSGNGDNTARLPNSAARDSFGTFEAPEVVPVTGQVQLNTTDERWANSESLNKFTHINRPLSTPPTAPTPTPPPRRDPLRNFGKAERMAIARWMRSNEAVSSQGKHAAAFQDLLQSLGCKDPSFNKDILTNLQSRVHSNISRIKKALKKCGAISFDRNDRFENMPIFEDWTYDWLENDWDGVYNTRKPHTDQHLGGGERYEKEVEGFVGGYPTKIEYLANTGAANIRDSENSSNPYKMNDYSKW